MIKAIKTIFWTCVFAGLALVARVINTINNNDIDRLFINTADGGSYVVDIKFDHSIENGVQNVLKYHPDAVVVSETRHYTNGDCLKWTTDGERMRYQYVWHIPMIGRVTWHWTVTGPETEGVLLGEL